MTLRRHETPNPEQVIETLENSGLDKQSTLIIGGGVLAILGFRAAHDVDIIVPRTVHSDLIFTGNTPSGWPLQRKLNTKHSDFLQVFSITDLPYLPLEIAPPPSLDFPVSFKTADEIFLNELKDFPRYEGYPYLPLELVRDHKKNVARRKNDKRDLHLTKIPRDSTSL